MFPELIEYPICSGDKLINRNIKAFRDHVRKMVNERKRGDSKTYHEDSSDMLSILLSDDYYHDKEESIIDEVVTFFFAGMSTVQVSTANLICYVTMNDDIKQKLLKEFMPVLEKKSDNFVKNLTNEDIDDFEFTKMCFFESLRLEPPLPTSATQTFIKDVTLSNGIHVKAYDPLILNFTAAGTDPT